MIWRQLFSGLIGFSGGAIVAGGVVALMVGLGIITRFIGITHTAGSVKFCEDAILLGAVAGNVVTTFDMTWSMGAWMTGVAGFFMGIFVGGWIMALAEIIHIFPVFCRRLGITKGLGGIVVALAAGKTAGSMLYFFLRWGQRG
jgi:stage V sporulation protein AB